jgi:rhodanese-related sulfurtransferase
MDGQMATQPDTERSPGAPPRWLLPALVGTLVALAALLAVAITTQPPTATAPAAQAPLDQPLADQAPAAADGAVEAPPETHGSLDPNGPAVQEIAVAEARAQFDAGTALFIDVRAGSDYAAGHIPGALTITSQELEQRMEELPEGGVIIAYGDAARPDSGQRGAQIFMDLGYPTVIALEGGFQAWRDAGHPVQSNQ